MIDPFVEEVRKARDNHACRFNYDLAAICDDIRKQQAKCGHKVVRLRRGESKTDKRSAKKAQGKPCCAPHWRASARPASSVLSYESEVSHVAEHASHVRGRVPLR